jgi:MFS family permease
MADIVYVTGAGGLLTIINADIGPSSSYSWIVTAFAVSSAVLSPLVGRLSDIFGRRNFLLAGNLFGLISAAIAATCHEVNVFVGASALAGIGVALHQISFTAVSEMVPKRTRGLALGAIESGLGLPGAFAPLMGYAMDERSSWRNLFWLIFAIQGGSFFLLLFFYHPINQYIKEEGKSRFQQCLSLDWVGLFLFFTGLVLFLLGISFGGSQFAW